LCGRCFGPKTCGRETRQSGNRDFGVGRQQVGLVKSFSDQTSLYLFQDGCFTKLSAVTFIFNHFIDLTFYRLYLYIIHTTLKIVPYSVVFQYTAHLKILSCLSKIQKVKLK
jgi:hypothetical protein